jgi:hypothetical protein
VSHRVSARLSVLALFVFAAIAGLFRLRAYDLFWHLAAGRWIVEHGALPGEDPLRFTSQSVPWVDHEWLFQVVVRFVEQLGGLDALVVFRAALVVLLAALLLYALRRHGAPLPGALIVTAGAILAARPRFMLRPELLSLLALAALLALLQEFRRSRSRCAIAAAVVLVIVWANVHPAVVIAPVVAAAYLVGGFAIRASQRDRGWIDAPAVIVVPALLALAAMANPAGFGIYSVPLAIRSALDDLGAVNPEWTPAWSAPQPLLIVGASALVIIVVWAVARSRRIDAATALVTVALAVLAASGVRHQGLFFIGAAFFAGESLADVARRPRAVPALSSVSWNMLALAASMLAAAWCAWTPLSGPLRARQGPYEFGLGLQSERFPVAAVDALETRPEVGPLYNDVAFGGYLAWRLYPRRVFIDGRNEVNPDLLREVVRARSDSRAWRALLERYGIERALVRYDDRLLEVIDPATGKVVSRRTPNALLFPPSAFALVYWDDVAMTFVRRTLENNERLSHEEYRFVHPEDRLATLEAAASDPAWLAGAIAEVERRLTEDPRCDRALALRDDLARIAQERRQADTVRLGGS